MLMSAFVNFFNTLASLLSISDVEAIHPCSHVPGNYTTWSSQAEEVGVVIIGGGVAGLSAAKTLLEYNVSDLLILEAKERLGGRVHTVREGGMVVELGAEWIHGDEPNPLYRIAEELDAVAPPMPEDWDEWAVTQDGESVSIYPAYTIIQKVMGMDVSGGSRGTTEDYFKRWYNRVLAGQVPADQRDAWLNFLESKAKNDIGSNDWSEVPLRNVMGYDDFGEDNQWSDGYDTFLDYLKESIPDENSRLSTPVCRIFWDEDDENKVLLVSQNGSSFRAYHVIVTASAGHLQERHKNLFFPQLPIRHALALESAVLGVVNKVQMGWEEQWWGTKPLSLNIIWTKMELPEEKSWLYSLSEVFSVVQSPKAVIEGFVAPKAWEQMENLSDEVAKEHFLELLRNVMQMEVPEPSYFRLTRWGSDPWTRGSFSTVITQSGYRLGITDRTPFYTPLYSKGRMVVQFAGEYTNDTRYSTVDGAMGSGEREAHRLLQFLSG